MIEVTDLHGQTRYINAEMIEMVESNPDTQIVLSNGHRFYVKETAHAVAEKVLSYRRLCYQPLERTSQNSSPQESAPQ